jgi:hypothetical protein
MPPKAVDAAEALRPEPTLSRPWAAPTKARPASTGGRASTAPVGGGHAPESGGCCGSASTGTDAFAAMGRSYNSVARSHTRSRIHRPCRRGPCPRKRGMPWKRVDRNQRFRGHGPLLQQLGALLQRVAHHGGYTRGTPLVGTPCGQAAAGHRPEGRPWAAPTTAWPTPTAGSESRGIYKGYPPCWYAMRPSRRGPPARKAAMARSYNSLAHSYSG